MISEYTYIQTSSSNNEELYETVKVYRKSTQSPINIRLSGTGDSVI